MAAVAELGSFGGESTPGAGSERGGDPETLPDRFSSLIGADQISEDERRLVVHHFDREGRGFLFVYFEWCAVTFPSAVVWRLSRRAGAFWPEIFESMNRRLPNNGAAPNCRLRFGPAP